MPEDSVKSQKLPAGIMPKDRFNDWIGRLLEADTVIGPAARGKHVVFRQIKAPEELRLASGGGAMAAPRKFIYPPRQLLHRFRNTNGGHVVAEEETRVKQTLIGVHSCDMHAILVLDRVFQGETADAYYARAREGTFIVAWNCTNVSENCFCSSMGTGPFLKASAGFDVLVTDLGEDYLMEFGSERGRAGVPADWVRDARAEDLTAKAQREEEALSRFTKFLKTEGLPGLLRSNLRHEVWRRVAEEKCLSCTNCTMVCPTCYCYDVTDRTTLNLRETARSRRWDSCQDHRFAEVHGGNFRSAREARLRQFVCHKLSFWLEQYGCFGCVGCGRCMTWCPTGIDLTEIAKEIQRDAEK